MPISVHYLTDVHNTQSMTKAKHKRTKAHKKHQFAQLLIVFVGVSQAFSGEYGFKVNNKSFRFQLFFAFCVHSACVHARSD